MKEKDIKAIEDIIEKTEDKRLVVILNTLLGAHYSGGLDHYANESANWSFDALAKIISSKG